MDIEYVTANSVTHAADADETIVIFRKWKDTGDIIALFPEQYEGHGLVGSYMHVGQHGSADYALVIYRSRPAKEWEYEDLYNELLGLGYRLRVMQKKPLNL